MQDDLYLSTTANNDLTSKLKWSVFTTLVIPILCRFYLHAAITSVPSKASMRLPSLVLQLLLLQLQPFFKYYKVAVVDACQL